MAKDKKGQNIYIGSWVKWYDPDKEARDLSRIYEVFDIKGDEDDEMILISDEFGEAEVLPSELDVIQ